VACKDGHVTGLSLQSVNIKGTLPESLGHLSALTSLQLDGTRPTSYQGCEDSNLSYAPLPSSFYDLVHLQVCGGRVVTWPPPPPPHGAPLSPPPPTHTHHWHWQVFSAENACLGGSLFAPGIANLTELTEFTIHQNKVSGTVPSQFDGATKLKTLKLDRNPLTVRCLTHC
jgi:hypothetical protein